MLRLLGLHCDVDLAPSDEVTSLQVCMGDERRAIVMKHFSSWQYEA